MELIYMVVGEMVEQRDLIIIGGGPGGYQAAIRAAQLGLNVTLIEKDQLGGVCLNRGCIPSKVFAQVAKKYSETKQLKTFGISTGEATFSITKLADYQDQVINNLQKGVQSLCQANKIEVISGAANFIAKNRIGVEQGHQFDLYEFTHAIIATGSKVVLPEKIAADHKRIFHSQNIYHIEEVPEHLIVYGNDYIALEVAFSFKKLGAKVTMLLNGPDFPFDQSINRELRRVMKRERIKLIRQAELGEVKATDESVEMTIMVGDEQSKLNGSHLFLSGYEQPNIASLGLDRIGVETDLNGMIKTDKTMKTSIDHIFAVGDVTTGPALAVKAIKQGKVAAEIIAGLNNEVDLTFIPTVVHSSPPIATVGLTEEAAKEAGYDVITSQFSLSGNGFAMITNEKAGIVKVIKEAETDVLLGFHMIGDRAIELISTGITSLEMAAKEEDLKFPLYPHPSYNETILEAIENLSGKAIHMAPVMN